MNCPKCEIKLKTVKAQEPWDDEYLICPKCDGTYNKFEFNDKVCEISRWRVPKWKIPEETQAKIEIIRKFLKDWGKNS